MHVGPCADILAWLLAIAKIEVWVNLQHKHPVSLNHYLTIFQTFGRVHCFRTTDFRTSISMQSASLESRQGKILSIRSINSNRDKKNSINSNRDKEKIPSSRSTTADLCTEADFFRFRSQCKFVWEALAKNLWPVTIS